jgi:hypothetical protein
MPDIDLDKLLKLAASPDVGKNADSLSGMLKEAEGVLNLADRMIKIADRAGALPGLVRAIGKKYGVDVETPLATQHGEDGIIPVSEFHKQLFNEFNGVPEKDLRKQFEDAAKMMKHHGAKKSQAESGPAGNQKSDST